MFQFSRCPPYTYLIQYTVHGHYSMWVSPFGNLRIRICLRLPAAYRSLPRPSSATGAKASSLRSFMLNLSLLSQSRLNMPFCFRFSLAVLSSFEFLRIIRHLPFVLSTQLKLFLLSAIKNFYFVVSLLTAAFSFVSQYSVLKVHTFHFASASLLSQFHRWWAQVESNHRPRAYQARALTI